MQILQVQAPSRKSKNPNMAHLWYLPQLKAILPSKLKKGFLGKDRDRWLQHGAAYQNKITVLTFEAYIDRNPLILLNIIWLRKNLIYRLVYVYLIYIKEFNNNVKSQSCSSN